MRYQYLDILRGVCIVLMVLFHLNYSLVNIFGSQIFNISEIFWYILGRVSALGFMVISGASFYLASQKYSYKELQKKYLKYSCVLAIIALGITLGTYFFMPEQLILFGILHLFALSFFLLAFITGVRFGAVILFLFLVIIALFWDKQVSNGYLFALGFYNADFASADYYPLVPYFGYILGGYLIADIGDKYNFLRALHIKRDLYSLERLFSYIGKRSLVIYIIHQPIIIGVVWGILKYI